MKRIRFFVQPTLLCLCLFGGFYTVTAQQVSPCVNITIHDLKPKINDASGAGITATNKGFHSLAISMEEWQGQEPMQVYFFKKLQETFPQVSMKRGGEFLESYIYGSIGITESFSLPALQLKSVQLRTEINNKIQEIGSDAAYKYYYDLVN